MSARDQVEQLANTALETTDSSAEELLRSLVDAPVRAESQTPAPLVSNAGIVIGELLAITDDGTTPLVIFPGQSGTSALRAKTVVDLHGAHIGKCVALMFESGNPQRPIVIGVLRGSTGWSLDEQPGQVDVDADGERLLVSAKEQLVLRCGKASITLTKAGKVLIDGEYLSSRSSGVNRIKGGSVQLN